MTKFREWVRRLSHQRAANYILFGTILLLMALESGAQNSIPREETWVPNGTVRAIATTPTTTYIGGDFTYVAPLTGRGVPIDINTGQLAGSFPKVNSTLSGCVSDGAGGWYIFGYFTQVGQVARNRMAHILFDGTVDPVWDPNPNDEVYALALSDDGLTVYVGGRFTSVGGQTRPRLAALDATTGLATDWNPNPTGYIYALAISGTTIYTGGTFTGIGGQSRNRIAALDATTGLATDWNPDANGTYLYTLAVSGTTVYAGGDFTTIGGQARNYIAALDASINTNNATGWDSNANGIVRVLETSGTTVYAGGNFTTIGGEPRNYIAALDTTLNTDNATDWDPNANGIVRVLFVSGTTVYAGGDFTTIGGQARNYIAALDVTLNTDNATDWDPNANGSVRALDVLGTTVYVGGSFSSICGLPRNRIFAIDAATGAPTDWNPNAGSYITALAISGTTVYAVGGFTSIGGQTRYHIAALDAATGLATDWNPNANGTPYALAVSGTTVYAGGGFTNIGGQTRNQIAAIDSTTGFATDWNPNITGAGSYPYVEDLEVSEDETTIIVGGWFSAIAGVPRSAIAAIDATTGLLTDWNPNVTGGEYTCVRSLARSGAIIYIGGNFTSVGGTIRSNLAAVDVETGIATDWNPNVTYSLFDPPWVGAFGVSHDGTIIYVGGRFNDIGGQTRNRVAAINAITGLTTNWDPNVSSSVNTLAVSGMTVYIGGQFTTIGGESRPYFAEFNPPTAPSDPGAIAIGLDTITWTWQDNSSDETGFQVYVDPGAASPTTLRATTAPDVILWQHDGLSANTQYAFQVAAVKDAEDLGRSGVRTEYTLIEPVSGLNFSDVTISTINVSASNIPSNLASGTSGLLFHNVTVDVVSPWQQHNNPWASTGLSPNTQYTFTGKSRNGASVETTEFTASKYTLATVPVAPVVTVTGVHTTGVSALDVAIGTGDGNPLSTLYAIQISPSVSGNNWVQADGSVGADPVYRLAATWDVRRVNGLAKDTMYTFAVVARNGENIDTVPGPGASASTYPNEAPGAPAVSFPSVQGDLANLVCAIAVASYDPDGDPVLYEFDWYVKHTGDPDFSLFQDGVPETAMSSQINSTDTAPGDLWYCVVTPHDMLESGASATSGECTIVLGGVTPSFISLVVNPTEIILGQSLTALGQIFPTPTGSGTVTFESTSPSGAALPGYPEGTVFASGAYSKAFYPDASTEGRSPWSLTATWPGDLTYQSATSSPVTYTVLKAQPSLQLSLSHASALLNLSGAEDFTVSATLSVSGFPAELQPLLAGRTVLLSVQTPDGQTPWAPLEATTDATGTAVFAKASFDAAGILFNPSGMWRFRAQFTGDENLRSVSTEDFATTPARLTIKEGAGYAILVLGRLDAAAEGHAEHGQTSDYIYSVLRGRNFAEEDICYLREHLAGEVDRGYPVWGPATAANLQYAIETWARDKMLASPAPLWLILVNHGNPGVFYMDIGATGPVEFVTAGDIGGWLDVLQSALGALKQSAAEQPVMAVYGGCYSGSFVPILSGLNRVVITSSSGDEIAYRGVMNAETSLRDGDFFLTEFFRNASEGRTLGDAFEQACGKTSEYTATRTGSGAHVPQHPRLDDNGDGLGTTGVLSSSAGLDGAFAMGLDLGLGSNAGNGVGWFTACPPVFIAPGDPLTEDLWAEATGRDLVPEDESWIEVKTPVYDDGAVATAGYEDYQRVAAMAGPIAPGAAPESLGDGRTRYRWSYADLTGAPDLSSGFTTPGTYKVYYFLRDGLTGQVGAYLVTNIYVSQTGNQAPSAVSQLYPDDEGIVNASLFLAWTESVDPDGDPVTYRAEVSEDPAFPEIGTIVKDGLTDLVVTLDVGDGIENDHDYYWRVIPTDPYGASPSSNDVRRFLVRGSPGVPGAITGSVTDAASGLGIAGGTLTLSPTALQGTSTASGAYFLGNISQGVYGLTISAPGYVEQQVTGVAVTSGRYTMLHVQLASDGNHAPALTAIGDHVALVGQALSFQLSATDSDSGQTLNFTAEGLPGGATLDMVTGQFAWTPGPDDVAGSPYTVNFTVTDNGEPPLSDTETIVLIVTAGAYITGPSHAVIGDRVELAYHGEYQPGLWHVQWDHDGTVIPDQMDDVLVIESVTLDDAGWYTATQISDTKADPVSASFYLIVYDAMPLQWRVIMVLATIMLVVACIGLKKANAV